MKVGPGLAAVVGHPDPRTYVLRMGQRARFWDGKPVTAADAVFSLRQSIAPTAANAFYLSDVRRVDQRGSDEIVIRLLAPNVALPSYLASGAGLVAEAAHVKEKGDAYGTPQGGIMCSGPFKLGSWRRGQSLTIMRNDHYWDPALQPHVTQIEFDFIDDPTTLTSALVSGRSTARSRSP
jgi:peptide/nickel transport system substrate-binding protein